MQDDVEPARTELLAEAETDSVCGACDEGPVRAAAVVAWQLAWEEVDACLAGEGVG